MSDAGRPALRLLALYGHALVAARPRQLRARLLRPATRRRFPPAPPAPAAMRPIVELADLWRSPAFEAPRPVDDGTRLASFERHYGEDVLGAARRGETAVARRLIDAWIDGNPPAPGDAWHPFPVSTRVGSWIAAATLDPEILTPRVSASLRRQLAFLAGNVEDDVLGNHVLRNARGLALGGAAFADGRLLARAAAILRRELPEQVLPDGGHYERSPAYHLHALRDLLEIRAVLPEAVPDELVDRMRRFASILARPDGAPALFNDGTVDAPRLSLPAAPHGVHVLRESGFVVVRRPPLWLAFRCGPAAPPYLPAHAHADALSLQLWWDGRPVLADPGAYTYAAGRDRDWFRGTAAHSTVVVDGRDQFEPWGAFRSGPLPRVTLNDVGETAAEASIELSRGIRHTRRVDWSQPDRILVDDRIDGTGTHRVESRLLEAPEPPPGVVLRPARDEQVSREDAWVSERIGERKRTSAVVVRREAQLPLQLGWTVELSPVRS